MISILTVVAQENCDVETITVTDYHKYMFWNYIVTLIWARINDPNWCQSLPKSLATSWDLARSKCCQCLPSTSWGRPWPFGQPCIFGNNPHTLDTGEILEKVKTLEALEGCYILHSFTLMQPTRLRQTNVQGLTFALTCQGHISHHDVKHAIFAFVVVASGSESLPLFQHTLRACSR